jgi:predicted O-linked N-acetylglucosamine transferase (SPINDLY family)
VSNPGEITVDQALAIAMQHHRRGELQPAEALYRQILQVMPQHVEATHFLGVLAHQAGHSEAALELIDRSLALAPNDAKFLSNRSEVLRALGRSREAIEALERALAIKPHDHDFVSNYGIALYELGEAKKAEATLRRAIEINPNVAEAHLHLSRVLREDGRIEEALREAQRAVEVSPQHVNAILNLGLTLRAANRLPEAEAECRRGIALDPNSHMSYSALATILQSAGRHEEAIAAFARAIELNPRFAPGYGGLGSSLDTLGRHAEAVAAYRKSIELNPTDHSARAGLGVSLWHAGNAEEGITHLRAAVAGKPDSPDYLNTLAAVLEEQGAYDEAMRLLEHAATLSPPRAEVESNLAKRLTAVGRAEEAIAHYCRAMELNPLESRIADNFLLALHYLPDSTPEQIFQEHLDWAERHANPLAAKIEPHANDRDPNRRLRIGYVSPDFYAHAVADFIEQILANHDRERFEVTCYSDVRKPDVYTERLRRLPEHWVDVARLRDDELARRVRDDQIDILIDLAGHTALNRGLVFARKPAPVQVTYLGYPDTTGQTQIDYRITDAFADPPGKTEAWHTEQLVRLPRSFLCYLPYRDLPDVSPLPADAGGAFMFASFNNLSKVTPRVIQTWSRLLHEAPGSRLMVKAVALEASMQDDIRQRFAQHGITADRLELIGRVHEFADHLALYQRVDLALDTFPYHGTTTTCEALSMGVPVVTLVGRTHVSRVGLSILSQVDLGELAAGDVDQYIAMAVKLAADRERLRALRASLRDRLRQSPLTDGPGVTRELEAAYRTMWRTWTHSA